LTRPLENQPPLLEDYNVFSTDRALQEAVAREAPGCDIAEVVEIGELAGRPATITLGFDANVYPPELQTHDRFGNRIDEVRFHPAWHALMRLATERGLGAAPWRDRDPSAHVRRAAKFFIWSQVESGHGCPLSMTYAAVPALRAQPELAARWEPALVARTYDPRLRALESKDSALCGMAMTEKQGGSDVRANQTRAVPLAARGPGCEYALTGHKWFCSAPMSDAFLVLAQTDAGLGCFLVPRVLEDGTRNPFAIQRLKTKLGNRSNASSEVEFDRTRGRLVGEEGRGVGTIVEMVNHTRLDCIIGSAGLIRAAFVQAVHHARYRRTFGAFLIDHPLMLNVLADLGIESEAATALFMRAARAIDESAKSSRFAALKRIGTALGKYYVCKRAPAIVGEALECLGGNGYVEESIMPRLYREAPLNSIWEGSGNINALDVVRIVQRQPDSLAALRDEIAPAREEPRVAAALQRVERALSDATTLETRARWLAEQLALLWQASLLLQHAPSAVADTFVNARLGERTGCTLGTLSAGSALRTVVDRGFALGAAVAKA
jgi:putative acyl-CoA dehydrogenase